jgi:hypothetical protein
MTNEVERSRLMTTMIICCVHRLRVRGCTPTVHISEEGGAAGVAGVFAIERGGRSASLVSEPLYAVDGAGWELAAWNGSR